MANQRFKLNEFGQLKGRDIFVDANILIYLFWPTGTHFYENNYAKVIRNLIRQNNNLFIDFLVISETINKVIRIEHKLKGQHLQYKDFRDSQDGKNALMDIYSIIKDNVLNNFSIVGKEIIHSNILKFLEINTLDFVDKATENLCQERNYVLLTNDKDFKIANIDILSGNPNFHN